jgi:hypothetical protein
VTGLLRLSFFGWKENKPVWSQKRTKFFQAIHCEALIGAKFS